MAKPHLFVLTAVALIGCGGDPFSPTFGVTPSSDSAIEEDGGAAQIDTDSGASSGGANSGAGGSLGTGGSTTGAGGATPSPPDAGHEGTGGSPAAGSDACALVTHDNGLGQTWQDCVPLGTYNLEQAMKACVASGAGMCIPNGKVCTFAEYEKVLGYTADGSTLIGIWGFWGQIAGYVAVGSESVCNAPTVHPDSRWY